MVQLLFWEGGRCLSLFTPASASACSPLRSLEDLGVGEQGGGDPLHAPGRPPVSARPRQHRHEGQVGGAAVVPGPSPHILLLYPHPYL